jgi:16S rRNA (guanine(527)-N(7))-methyltransferase RsmG
MTVNSSEALKGLMLQFDIQTGSEASRRLQQYLSLLEKWNARINLTSSTDWPVVGPLFEEGIWASKKYPQNASSHLDIGSGGGFPALLLGIFNPQVRMDLVESRQKKCAFLETAAGALGLERVKVHSMRLQEFLRSQGSDRTWDCVSWKALKLSGGDLSGLLAHVHEDTQFWMFHGKELALEDPGEMEQRLLLISRGKFASRTQWTLSIYRPLL